MKKVDSLLLYISGFIFWSLLLIMRLCEIIPYEKISQISAQIELFLNFFMLVAVSKIYAEGDSNDRTIVFWLIPLNIGLFLNDLTFYFIIYFSENPTFKISLISFLINFIPYLIWLTSILIFLINLVKKIFTLKNFIKMFSILMLINCIIIFIFFNSIQPAFKSLSWQNISQIFSSLAELVVYNLCILCLIHSEKKGLSFIVVGLIILISGDFIISYSYLAQTNSIATYGELFWFLGILCIFFGTLELKRQNHVNKWLRSIKSIKSKLAFWAFGISLVNTIPIFILACWFSSLNQTIFLIIPPFIMITSVLVVILSLFTVKHFEKPFQKIADNIKSLMLDNDKSKLNQHFLIEEFIYLQEFILNVFDIKEEQEATKKILVSLTTQVAHDIRSPLAAINTTLSDVTSIPENKRIIIRNAAKRINDIANNLLFQSKNNLFDWNSSEINKNNFPELIFVVLDNIVAEKRYEYYGTSIQINLRASEHSHNCFSRIHSDYFKRVLSNLINNGIEAVNSNGSIIISLACDPTHVEIIIEDNGCGIPQNILPKITEQGFSFNKKMGAGFGLSYAKRYLKQINGSMNIYSKEKVGTKIQITLIRSTPPSWFCDSINIRYGTNIVVLDDDISIHDAWNERFSNISQVKISHFYKVTDFLQNIVDPKRAVLYLVDYELLGDVKNGLDVIEELNLNKQAILVTSCFEDIAIRNRCENIGIKIIPKSYVPYIKIIQIPEQIGKVVFIDDDEMMRMTWIFAAEEAGQSISTYSSFDEFINEISSYDKETLIYIDSDLSNHIKGENCAKFLFDEGFTNIHLTTGHSKEWFNPMPWIKSIVGKKPPFPFTHENIKHELYG